ncbi:uncharacterized protein E0L32_005456 [Thyridium curvatum]|uniref:Uncharacterized protein n=1 Tax=Thyridium curvatum TaxID=1093900 RepID=A0A507AX15_9PEZI|nr:uncharacterized protein E0L32_005456 [Thyridium curvatum]TPX14492.1 hypothetical protein E0L32_005456 [Thyridium curvatum]
MAPPRRPATPPTPSPSQLPPVPSSPTYSYASTANPISQFNLPLPPPPRPAHAVLSRADLDLSHAAYADLLASAKAYRVALAALGTAASSFGSALETCARLKEARAEAIGPLPTTGLGSHDGGGPTAAAATMSSSFVAGAGTSCTADPLLAISGVHHLVANHQQILSETVYRSFEVPLLHELDKWRREVDDENEGYESRAREQSREIRRLEKEGLKLHRQQKRRDVARFREHLVELTAKLDGLTSLHADHARALLRECQETSARIADASCSLVRAEVDIFESLARKGWSGGGLDDVLEKGHDLFAAAAEEEQFGAGGGDPGSKIFSILPPKSILADSASDSAALHSTHGRSDSLTVDGTDRYQSLEGALSPVKGSGGGGGGETDSVFSEPIRGRGIIRPFSPQPVAVDPDEVMGPRLEPPSQSSAFEDPDNTPRPTASKIARDIASNDGYEDDDDPWRRDDDDEHDVSRTSSVASSQRARRDSVTLN